MRKLVLSIGVMLLLLAGWVGVRLAWRSPAGGIVAAGAPVAVSPATPTQSATLGIPPATVGSSASLGAGTGTSTPAANPPPALVTAPPPTVTPTVEPVSDEVVKQIQALQLAKSLRTPAQQKLDSQLIDGEKMQRGEPVADGVATLRSELDKDDQDRVLTDIDAQVSDELLRRITDLGGVVVSSFTQFNAIRARLPLAQIETLAARADVQFIRPAVQARTNVGSVTSEGDQAQAADVARAQFNVTGAGVKVAVLSDSVDHLAASQASGDLGTVTVLAGQAGAGEGEGTAMLEIVHDLAPGSDLFFATGFGGAAAFAQNILNLRFQSHCDIIIDDLTYFNESPFQDGVIAQAVNAVTADGALFFSSAANSGNQNDGTSATWEGDFVDGGDFVSNGQSQGRWHNFGGGVQNTATRGGNVDLFWADPLGHSANDYDVYVLSADGGSVVAAGTSTQNGTQDPYESVSKANDGERIVIVKYSGAARFLHLDARRGKLTFSTSGSTRGHNAAKDAFTVAAVDANTSFPAAFTGNAKNPVETFSSDGLRRMFFNPDGSAITPGNFSATGGTVWQKPDIAAADGVKTTLPANSGLNPFFGTSAAAPHAGAVAALLKSYNPALTPTQIRAILTGTALDIEAAGTDRDSGAGIVMAVAALQAAASPELPAITSFAPTTGGVGANVVLTGTKLNGATQVKFNGVAATFTVDSATQISATVPAGATTGQIVVTTPAGTATSAASFTVQPTPAITSLTPLSGGVGATVVIAGANLNGATAVKFNNVNQPAFTVNSAAQITTTVPAGATSGRVTVTTGAGTATSGDVFTVTTLPRITGFAPGTGGVGASVGIDGANLGGASAVRFNGVSATVFTVDSAIHITATVPAGATTGPISVTTPNGTTNSAASFTVISAPGITGFTPTSGAVGGGVTISGNNFAGATAVRFNGVTAPFTVNSPTQITATIPEGAATGPLAVTTPGGTATSAGSFTILSPPGNDNFANAQSLSGSSGSVSGNNAAATKEAGEPDHAGNGGGKSVWYNWNAPSSGAVQFTTIGSGFDTVLAVYTGNSVGALTLVASGDDTPGGTNSALTLVANAGTLYRVAVDGFRSPGAPPASASAGNVVLNWSPTRVPAIIGFSPAGGAPNATVIITGANFTGATAVRFNGVSAAFTVNNGGQITAIVPATATTGVIQVAGPRGSAVSATSFAVVNPPANNAFANAQVITGNSGSVSGRNTDATKEVNEPNPAGNPGGRSVWYAWTAPASGLWTFDTQGSGFDTVLGVYTGSSVGGLVAVASNDDSSPGTISRVAFLAAAGATYRIQVDGHNGASGSLVLNWTFTPNPPSITSFSPTSGGIGSTVALTGLNFTGATGVRLNGVLVPVFTVDSATQITLTVPLGVNSGPFSVLTPNGTALSAQSFTVTSGSDNDQFANAQVLTGSATIVVGQNLTATKEPGEPAHAGNPGGRSVWYRWTAPANGTWALDTAGSSFDTILAVYTGATVNALTVVASNDDARDDLSSRVTFTATSGTTYQIAVDGYGGGNGNLTLKLLPAAAPQVIYETGFEAAQGFSTGSPLIGQGGWQGAGSGGNGIVTGFFPDSDQQAYLGYTPPNFGDDSLFLWRPVNFTPETNSRPLVRFSVTMGIVDSDNYEYDSFEWSVYNLSGQRLFTLDFDNSDLTLYYLLDDGTGYHYAGGYFENGTIYDLEITMDFARNRWIASLDGEPMDAEQPITTTGAARNLGDVDAVWLPTYPDFPGDNTMIFDDYRLTAEPSELPAIVVPPASQSVTVGSPVSFGVVASGGEPLAYQWRFNGTTLPGETGAVLTLNNVDLGQAGSYSVVVSNRLGSVTSSATLTLNQPGPVSLTAGARLPDGRFQFTVQGTPGSRVAVEFSTDLVQWQNLTTVVLSGSTMTLADPDTGNQPCRFYRARLQP